MDPYSTQVLVFNQLSALSSIFFEYVVSVLYAMALLVAGLIVAEIVKHILTVVLKIAGWNRFCAWSGLTGIVHKLKPGQQPISVTVEFVFWLLVISFAMKALMIANIPACAWIGRAYFEHFGDGLQAGVWLLSATLLARWLGLGIALGSDGPLAWLAAPLVKILIFSLAVFLSLQSLGLEREVALPLVLLVFGSMALAVSLSWALHRAQGFRQLIRVEEQEEGRDGA